MKPIKVVRINENVYIDANVIMEHLTSNSNWNQELYEMIQQITYAASLKSQGIDDLIPDDIKIKETKYNVNRR